MASIQNNASAPSWLGQDIPNVQNDINSKVPVSSAVSQLLSDVQGSVNNGQIASDYVSRINNDLVQIQQHESTPTDAQMTQALKDLSAVLSAAFTRGTNQNSYLTDPMQEPASPQGTHWNTTPASVDLYPSGTPSPFDICQQQMGDCYLDASLAAMAQNNPSAIQNAIKQTGTGEPPTYDVSMYDPSGNPVTVAVNGNTLYDSHGKSVNSVDEQGKPTWATIMEKAYAKYNQVYGTTTPSSNGGYGDIANGGSPRAVLEAFTGQSATAKSTGDSDTFTTMQNNLNNHVPMAAVSNSPTAKDKNGNGIVGKTASGVEVIGDHCYSVSSIDMQNQTVTLRNPWAFNYGSKGDNGTVTMSFAEYQKFFGYTDFTNAPGGTSVAQAGGL